MLKNHYVYVGNDSYGRIFICPEEEQAYREPVVRKNKIAAYLGVFFAVLLYGIRDRLVWPGMEGKKIAIVAVIIGLALGFTCYCLIERYIKRIYAGKKPLDTETLELELVLKTGKKQQVAVLFCFLFLLGLSIVMYFFTTAKGNYLFFFCEIMLVACIVMTIPYYQPWRRKKAIKLIKRWKKEQKSC